MPHGLHGLRPRPSSPWGAVAAVLKPREGPRTALTANPRLGRHGHHDQPLGFSLTHLPLPRLMQFNRGSAAARGSRRGSHAEAGADLTCKHPRGRGVARPLDCSGRDRHEGPQKLEQFSIVPEMLGLRWAVECKRAHLATPPRPSHHFEVRTSSRRHGRSLTSGCEWLGQDGPPKPKGALQLTRSAFRES